MSARPRTGAANFSLTAPMGAVGESTNQPTLAYQQKCEKLWTLPHDNLDRGSATSAAAMFEVDILKPGVLTLIPKDTDILRSERVVDDQTV